MRDYNEDAQRVVEILKERIPNKVSSVYLTGSRLYGINKLTSDVDLIIYVVPTAEGIIWNKAISEEVKINEGLIEKVDVKDIRLVLKELRKPNLNSLHLLEQSLYGEPAMEELIIRESFRANSKNLYLSILSYAGKAVKSEEAKDKVRGMLFYTIYCMFKVNGFNSNFFISEEYFRKSNMLRVARLTGKNEVIDSIPSFARDVNEAFQEEVEVNVDKGDSLYLIPHIENYISELLKDNINF